MSFLETVRDILRREGMSGMATDAPGPESPVDGQPAETSPSAPTIQAKLPTPGTWIEWASPLFPLMRGKVIHATEFDILVWHPKAEDLRNISGSWVTRLLTGPDGTNPYHINRGS